MLTDCIPAAIWPTDPDRTKVGMSVDFVLTFVKKIFVKYIYIYIYIYIIYIYIWYIYIYHIYIYIYI